MRRSGRLIAERLAAQQIGAPVYSRPAEVVAWLGAVQAQDYPASKWAVGLRLSSSAIDDAAVEAAISAGDVLRTHAMRGTWQLIAREDARWIVALVGPRVLIRSASRHRELGLDEQALRRALKILEKQVRDGEHRTRDELATALNDGGVSPAGQRLSHLLGYAELSGLLASGARKGKHATYAALELRTPEPKSPFDREAALVRLAERYFKSRGPATIDDFVWWSGLTVFDAKLGIEGAASKLESEVIGEKKYWRGADVEAPPPARPVYLLPAFDEYLIAYKDRDAMLDPQLTKRVNNTGGLLAPCVVVRGRIAGTWKRTLSKKSVDVELELFEPLSRSTLARITAVERAYAAFLGLELGSTNITPAL